MKTTEYYGMVFETHRQKQVKFGIRSMFTKHSREKLPTTNMKAQQEAYRPDSSAI